MTCRDLNAGIKGWLTVAPSQQSIPPCAFVEVTSPNLHRISSLHSSHTVMSVPSGNDFPRVSNSYVFTIHGTNQAFTLASGGRLVLQAYSRSNRDQVFRCERVTATNRLGFVNTGTNRRILRDQREDVWARPHARPSVWESFSFEGVSGGGFRMTNVRYNAEAVIRRVDENGKSAYGLPCFDFRFM
jgi:hypothetical protein